MANAPRPTPVLDDPFKLTLLILAIIAFMDFAAEVLKPLALAILLSFALAAPVRWLGRVGVPRLVAVVLTAVLALGALGELGYVVGEQLTTLANELPDYQSNIEAKLSRVWSSARPSAVEKLSKMSDEVVARLNQPAPADAKAEQPPAGPLPRVVVVEEPSLQQQIRSAIGPYLEFLGVGSIVLILVLFILMGQEDLSDRIVSLFGHRQVSLTTRTTEEIGRRISRYLATFALVNSAFGLVIGVGLAVIGVPFAVLWGCLAAVLRFIPYVGPAVAFVLPVVFSFAYFPGWLPLLEVIALFAVIETILNSFLEPIIYGKTTGVSALALLVAAMFWTWLWGTLGLLLSTPLTVCLAVIGKFVPGLRFFATLLGEEADLEPHVRFYQRLVALDREGALAQVEKVRTTWPRADVFDRVLVPTLRLAERDLARDELKERDHAFIQQVIAEIVEHYEGVPELSLKSVAATTAAVASAAEAAETTEEEVAAPPSQELVGVAVGDASDVLVLQMLGQLLTPAGCHLEVLGDEGSPLQVVEQVAERDPRLVVLSHIPSDGVARSRYLVRRLRARFNVLPIVVGRWGETGTAAAAAERQVGAGATHVVFTLAEARERILARLFPDHEDTLVAAGEPETSSAATAATPE